MSQWLNSVMFRSLLIKLAMLAATVVLVLWIGWPGSNGPGREEPVQNPGEGTEEPSGAIPLETRPASPDVLTRSATALTPGPGQSHFRLDRLDLNEATVEELQALPGVGPVLASRIVERRSTRGPFHRIEELQDVKGIGRKRVEQLRPLVRVGERNIGKKAGGSISTKKGRE